jgi:membrane protease YdiL (CAAX protease family)
MQQFVLAVAGMLVMTILFAGIVCWSLAAMKVARGQPLVAWSPRRAVPWGFLDLVATVGLYVISIVVLREVLAHLDWLPDIQDESQLTLADKGLLVGANIGISLGLLLVVIPLIALRTAATARDLGFAARETLSDLKLGVAGFVMLAPPVYAIQGVLVYFWQPSKHPLMEMFKTSPDASFFTVLFIAAAVVAPIFEELIFRVLLQGFLEKAFVFRGRARELLLGGTWPAEQFAAMPVAATESSIAAPVYSSGVPLPDINPFTPSAIVTEPPALADFAGASQQRELGGLAAWLPIGTASLIFALMHYTHGPDWVALTLLAAGMGYLYQRTHRLVPSLVVHTLLNSLSMLGLWIQVYVLPEQGLGP